MAQVVREKNAMDGKISPEIMMIMAVTVCATRKRNYRDRVRESEKSNYSIISSRTAETAAARAQQKINTDHTMAVLHYSQV